MNVLDVWEGKHFFCLLLFLLFSHWRKRALESGEKLSHLAHTHSCTHTFFWKTAEISDRGISPNEIGQTFFFYCSFSLFWPKKNASKSFEWNKKCSFISKSFMIHADLFSPCSASLFTKVSAPGDLCSDPSLLRLLCLVDVRRFSRSQLPCSGKKKACNLWAVRWGWILQWCQSMYVLGRKWSWTKCCQQRNCCLSAACNISKAFVLDNLTVSLWSEGQDKGEALWKHREKDRASYTE